MFASGVSHRRSAKLLNLSRTTIARKFLFLGNLATIELEKSNQEKPLAMNVQFDDLETFEHTKYKPLSVTLIVEAPSRRILGFEVARFAPKGLLAKVGKRKYPRRLDERSLKRRVLFEKTKDLIHPSATINSDQNPYYAQDVKTYFPNAKYETFKGQRGSIVGQGELKKVRFDPLFSLNHTCAMLRANINRLFRKTWCTTKISERLALHLAIYAVYHNKKLIESS
jgi:hypothetical protein